MSSKKSGRNESWGGIKVVIAGEEEDMSKACKGCSKPMDDSATSQRRGTKYCSVECYRDQAKKIYYQEAVELKNGSSSSMSPTHFLYVYCAALLSALTLMVLILILVNSRYSAQINYNYTILQQEMESSEEIPDPEALEIKS